MRLKAILLAFLATLCCCYGSDECRQRCSFPFSLDLDLCKCVPINQSRCEKVCNRGFTLDFKSCECVVIKEDTCRREQCKIPCHDGYRLDAHGCPTCQCLPLKQPHCNKICPVEYELDLKICECLPVKKPVCLDLDKKCQEPCQYGYALDAHGCETCDCLPFKGDKKIPQEPHCDKKCPVDYALDFKICECVFIKNPVCRFKECKTPCQYGYALDAHGCETCECLPPRPREKFPVEPHCNKKCPVEYELDLKTCDCVLSKKPVCRFKGCQRPCLFGYRLDSDGCETCKCLPSRLAKDKIPRIPLCEHRCPVEYAQDLKTCECFLIKKPVCQFEECKTPCQYGYVLDAHGCKTCECLPPKVIKDNFPQKPHCEFKCPIQYEQDLKTCECLLIKKPVCRFKGCKTPCQYGYVLDAHGCETCECLPPKVIKDNFPQNPRCEFKCPIQYEQDLKTCECLLIKKPVCRFKGCKAPCQYGYVLDAHGCETCECLPPKVIKDNFPQKAHCEFKCPIQYEQDLKTCECVLIKKPVCRFKGCKTPCQYGYVLDAHGCETCECLPPKVIKENFPQKPRCEFKCPIQYEQDLKTCECVLIKKPVCRFKGCKTPCQYGYVLDAHGCETCECLPPKVIKDNFPQKPRCEFKCPIQYEQDLKTCECVLIKKPVCRFKECRIPCQYGYVLDSHGCETCECLPFNEKKRFPVEPVCDKRCPIGYELDLKVCDCIFISKPVCRFKECKRPCQFGYVFDSNGCQTCQCLPDVSVRSFDSRGFDREHQSFAPTRFDQQEQTFRFDGFEIRPERSQPTRFDRQPQRFSSRRFDRRQPPVQPRKLILRREQRDRRFEQDRQRFERQHF